MSAEKILTFDMSESEHDEVINCLRPFVTDQRFEVFEEILQKRTRDACIVLEHVANPHNASAVMRSAEAFGLFELHVVPQEGTFSASRNVASGAQKWLDFHMHSQTKQCFDALRSRGYQIWASDLQEDAQPIENIDFSNKVALVFGNERDGISEYARKHSDHRFVVPMHGFVESFNISVAAAISIYHVSQARAAQGLKPGLDLKDHKAVLASWMTQSVRASQQILLRQGLKVPIIRPQRIQVVE